MSICNSTFSTRRQVYHCEENYGMSQLKDKKVKRLTCI